MTIRKRAVKLVLSISDRDEEYRKIGQPPPTYQYFLCPKIEFSAKHYSDMVEITSDGVGHFYYMPAPFYAKSIKDKKVRVTLPPLIRKFTRIQIIEFIRRPFTTPYYCHSQACERGVKVTSKATESGKMKYELQLGQALMAERCIEETPAVIRKNMTK